MKQFLDYITARMPLSSTDKELVEQLFIPQAFTSTTCLLKAGQVERHLYFLCHGIVKGYQNQAGKIVVGHLVTPNNFFGSLDSFMTESPSLDYFEAVTNIQTCKISKPDFELLKSKDSKWGNFIEQITNEHLKCKMDRVKDFQLLTAKERYLKFLKQSPELALQVSVESIASFLGVEPQSLSRIRKQITRE
ncbi:Crp/Fnr family transcriptional regulator [Aureispira anguillae]|uniref:Crp/Fnr family transcriptional regulator n=1 Tax=Aureispira anguillae TaxID=2864201 RepID=A0A915YGL8_9BACT|nr:Crp/Fnr family transcriptional regulator [Aureispira anguillae]BDS12631.1 Crp/Fnr family transcriptional regulator [Aureispira anguillae]